MILTLSTLFTGLVMSSRSVNRTQYTSICRGDDTFGFTGQPGLCAGEHKEAASRSYPTVFALFHPQRSLQVQLSDLLR